MKGLNSKNSEGHPSEKTTRSTAAQTGRGIGSPATVLVVRNFSISASLSSNQHPYRDN
jgi:hypothetical protein